MRTDDVVQAARPPIIRLLLRDEDHLRSLVRGQAIELTHAIAGGLLGPVAARWDRDVVSGTQLGKANIRDAEFLGVGVDRRGPHWVVELLRGEGDGHREPEEVIRAVWSGVGFVRVLRADRQGVSDGGRPVLVQSVTNLSQADRPIVPGAAGSP